MRRSPVRTLPSFGSRRMQTWSRWYTITGMAIHAGLRIYEGRNTLLVFHRFPSLGTSAEAATQKSLAGYSDGVIPLRDASDAECQATEGLLGHQFVPSHMRYRPLRSERHSALPVAFTFWKTRWCSPCCAGSRGSCIL